MHLRALYMITVLATAMILVFSCTQTVRQTVKSFPDKPGYSLDQDKNLKLVPEKSIETGTVQEKNNIIDDFENGIKQWETQTSPGSMTLVEQTNISGNDNVLVFKFYFISKKQFRVNPDYALIRIRRQVPFENYHGIRFSARSSRTEARFKVMLIETNEVKPGLTANKIWFLPFNLSSGWKTYSIPFTDLKQEEYYEQAYIGDDLLHPDRIRQVAFSIDNTQGIMEKTGIININDVILY
jgi:hypothetical protein